jgi:hypothetical protein
MDSTNGRKLGSVKQPYRFEWNCTIERTVNQGHSVPAHRVPLHETGISNVIVNPDLYEKYRVVINREKFLRVEGVLQNQDHTISIKASRVLPVSITTAETQSHDFH